MRIGVHATGYRPSRPPASSTGPPSSGATPSRWSTSRGTHVYVAPVSTSASMTSNRSPARFPTWTATLKWPTPESAVRPPGNGNRSIAPSRQIVAGPRAQSTLGSGALSWSSPPVGDWAPGSRASYWSPLSTSVERGTGGEDHEKGTGGEDPKGEGIKGVRTRRERGSNGGGRTSRAFALAGRRRARRVQ